MKSIIENKKIILIIALTIALLVVNVLGQSISLKIKTGIYGVYLDWSTEIELKIDSNQTFIYHERIKFGSFECSGNWLIKKGEVNTNRL